MSIKTRRGLKADFVPAKMVSGEWAVVTDQKEVFITFAPGDCKQLMTVEDATAQLLQAVATATAEAEQFATNSQNSANASATSATNSATKASESASSATRASQSATAAKTSEVNADGYQLLSRSYAIGDAGGVRANEDTDNSKYYSEVARGLNQQAQEALNSASQALHDITAAFSSVSFTANLLTGELLQENNGSGQPYIFTVNYDTGELLWELP